MIIECEKCKTRFQLDERNIPRDIFKAKCSKCGHVFTVHCPSPREETPIVLEAALIVEKKRVLSICNQKGGVAKTTTCHNLGASLALMGKKVLLVDLDIQANLSMLFDCRNARSLFDVLEKSGPSELPKAILKMRDNLWLLPSNSRMALFSKKHLHQPDFEHILDKQLARVRGFFDIILIDTPPSLDFFTINALMASDIAVIPTQSEFLSMNGVGHVENMIGVIGEKTDHKIDYRILVSLYDPASPTAKVIYQQFLQRYGARLLQTKIALDSRVQESQILRTPVIYYDKTSPAALSYLKLAKEILAL